jgi:biotin synthase-related radical SAM superfamily protein
MRDRVVEVGGAIMQQARSTRRPPSSTLVRHTTPRRRLTKNLDNRSNLQLE